MALISPKHAQHLLRPVAVADRYTLDDLVAAVAEAFELPPVVVNFLPVNV